MEKSAMFCKKCASRFCCDFYDFRMWVKIMPKISQEALRASWRVFGVNVTQFRKSENRYKIGWRIFCAMLAQLNVHDFAGAL
jgi:hypothetical protein